MDRQFQINDIIRHKEEPETNVLVIRNKFDQQYVNFRSEDYLLVTSFEDRKDLEK